MPMKRRSRAASSAPRRRLLGNHSLPPSMIRSPASRKPASSAIVSSTGLPACTRMMTARGLASAATNSAGCARRRRRAAAAAARRACGEVVARRERARMHTERAAACSVMPTHVLVAEQRQAALGGGARHRLVDLGRAPVADGHRGAQRRQVLGNVQRQVLAHDRQAVHTNARRHLSTGARRDYCCVRQTTCVSVWLPQPRRARPTAGRRAARAAGL